MALLVMARTLGTRLGLPAFAAFLEMAEPSISGAVAAAVSGGAQRIVIVPYFLHPGMHVSRDIVGNVDVARAAYPQVAFTLAAFLGAHPAIGDLLVDVTRQSLAGHRGPKAV